MFDIIGGLILVSHAPKRWYSAGGFWGCDKEPLEVQGDKSGAVVGIISFLKAQKCLRKGHTAILALVSDASVTSSKMAVCPFC